MAMIRGGGRSERLAFTFGSRGSVGAAQTRDPRHPAAAAVTEAPADETRDSRAFTWLLVFTLVLFLRPQDIIAPLGVLHLAELSAIAGLFALFVGRLRHRASISRMTPEFAGVLALGAIILFTAPFSIWFGGSFAVFTDLYAKVILVYLLAVNAISSPKRLERLTWVLVLAVGYVGFRAVVDYARGVNLVAHGTRVQGSVGGIMQNPNDLALNMVAFVPLAVLFALGARTIGRRVVAAGCALFMVGAIVASGSRGGFVGFLAMLLVLGIMLVRRYPGVVLAAVLAGLCALPVLPSNYWRRIESITDRSKDDFGSAEARETLMRESLQAYVENPVIGVGAGEFKDWNPGHRVEAWHESHNVWLQVAAELGTLGLAALVFLVTRAFVAIYQTRRLLRRTAGGKRGAVPINLDPSERALLDFHSAAMTASLAGWFVCAFFASVAYNWTFYYLLGLCVAARQVTVARARAHARARTLGQQEVVAA
jgi:O-antigen ligase